MLLKHDVESLRQGGLPLTVACLLLACAEALQHRMTNALIHLQGAFGAFATTRKALPSSNISTPSSDSSFDSSTEDDDTIFTFRKMDLQLMTFALGNAPLLPSSPNLIFTAADLASPERSLFQVLHSAYQFASSTTQFFYKYLPDTRRPSNLYVEQGRHITNLRTWLAVHGLYPDGFRTSNFQGNLSSESRGTSEEITQNMIFTAQALSCLIYLSTLLHPTETIYDDFDSEFQQIVQCVSAVLDAESKPSHSASSDETANNGTDGHRSHSRSRTPIPSRTNTFTPELGVIQPVFFTALKYRHPIWRRKAIALLLRTGREGPWWGELEAACASMAIRAEETATRKAMLEKTNYETDVEPKVLWKTSSNPDHANDDESMLGDAIRSMGFNDDNEKPGAEGRYHPGHSHNDPNYQADYHYLDDEDDEDEFPEICNDAPHPDTTVLTPTNRPLLSQRISHLPSQPPWVLSLSPSSIPEVHRVCGDTIWDVTELDINHSAKFPGDHNNHLDDHATYPGYPGAPSRPYGIGSVSVSNMAGSTRAVAQYITVQLSRCLDIDGLVRSEESEEEKKEKFWEFTMVKTRFA